MLRNIMTLGMLIYLKLGNTLLYMVKWWKGLLRKPPRPPGKGLRGFPTHNPATDVPSTPAGRLGPRGAQAGEGCHYLVMS